MKFRKYGLATVLALGIFIGTGAVVLAATGEAKGNRDIDAVLHFKPSDEITEPRDPLYPTPDNTIEPIDPINPEKPIQPGTKGPLSIDFASNLYFGEHKISSKDQEYYPMAQPVKDERAPNGVRYVENYVQVTDNRGTLSGWILSVKQNGQFTSTASGRELTGAEISFLDGKLGGDSSIWPTISPNVVGSVTLNPEGSIENVVVATMTRGAGTWTYLNGNRVLFIEQDGYLANPKISLTVPGKTVKLAESYSTSLTWILKDVPGYDIEEPEEN